MFGFLKKKSSEPEKKKDTLPELAGLRLGGSFRFDDLNMKLIEANGLVSDCSREVLIEAIGVARVDSDLTFVRYYHSDNGFIQVNVHGDTAEQNISDVIAFYFYGDAPGINSDSAWEDLLKSGISKPVAELEEHQFERSFSDIDEAPPIAFSEKVTETDGDESRVDQFFMLYNRTLANDEDELLLLSAEEKVGEYQHERSFWQAVGYPMTPSSFSQIS